MKEKLTKEQNESTLDLLVKKTNSGLLMAANTQWLRKMLLKVKLIQNRNRIE